MARSPSSRFAAVALVLVTIALALSASWRAVRADDKQDEDVMRRVQEHVRKNERREAIKLLQKHLEGHEKNAKRAELRWQLAMLLEQANDRAVEEEVLRAMIEEDEGYLVQQASWRLMNVLGFSFYLWSDRTWGPGEVPQIALNVWTNDATRKRDPIPFELFRVDASKIEAELSREPRPLEALVAAPPKGSLEKIDSWEEPWPDRERGRTEPLKIKKASTAGIYLLVARPHGITMRMPLVVAPHSLVVKRAGDRALVFATNRADGAPLAGLALEALGPKDGKLARIPLGKTDEKGIWDGKVEPNSLVFSFREGAIAASHSWWWWGGHQPFVTHFSTDRPIYRPGQVVHWKAIVRGVGPTGEYVLPEKDRTYNIVVRDQNGSEVWKGDKKANEFGTFSGDVELSATAALGHYWVQLGGVGSGSFRVEEYRKPEFSVSVSAPSFVIQGDALEAKVQAKYYFGAPVAKGKVHWEVYRRPHWRPWWLCFPNPYAWYYDADEENPWRGYSWGPGEQVAQGEGELAADGSFKVATTIKQGDERFQDEMVTVVARVVDASRREEAGSAEVLAPRASFSLNVQQERWVYRPGDEIVLQVKALDPENKPRAGVTIGLTGAIQVWREGKGYEKDKQVAATEAKTDETGTATLRFAADARGSLQVVLSAKDEKGREVHANASFWLADELWASPTRSSVELVPDKKAYKPGETATVLCAMPREKGTALITREREGIIAYKVETWEKGNLLLKMPLDETDCPNVYVSVTTISGQFFHGVTSLAVPPEKKLLDVEVTFDKATYKPKEKATVTVKAKERLTGKPAKCEVALGVVDASIYALAADTAPDLRKLFHRKRPLSVQTQSSFEWYVSGQAGGGAELKAAEAAPGAPAPARAMQKAARGRNEADGLAKDEAGPALAEAEVRSEFPDTWSWSGHLVTNDAGEAKVELIVPDSLTTWRATARAVTTETAVGNATAEANVFLPVLVRAEPPRFLVQGDVGGISAIAHNYLEEPKKMKLSWKATGALALGKPTISGAAVAKMEDAAAWVEVGSKGEVRLDFFGARAERPGAVSFEVTAQTDEAADAMRTPAFLVLPHGAPRFEAWAGALTDKDEAKVELSLPTGAIPEATELELSVSPSVAATMLDSLEYLAGYPYGCVEQTMSRFLPDVVALEALRKCGVTDDKLKAELPKMIKAGLERLRNFQHPDGGWGWWEHDQTHPYMTAYVVYGLALARQADVALPGGMIERGVSSLSQQLAGKAKQSHGPDEEDPNARAYMLFALAQAGQPHAKDMVSLFEKREKLNHYGRAVLARALALGKKTTEAKKVAEELVAAAQQTGGLVWWDVDAKDCGWTRHDTETTAQALHALEDLNVGEDLWPKAIRWLVAHRKGRQWYSTRDTAMIVYVLAEHLARSGELEAEEDLSVRVGDKEIWKGHVDKTNVLTLRGSLKLKAQDLGEARTITFTRSGKGACYWSASLRTVTFGEDLKASSGPIQVARSIEVLRRSATGEEKKFALGSEPVLVGDELHVTLTVSAGAVREYLLIEDPIPAGCEFVREDLGGEGHGNPMRPGRPGRRWGWEWGYWYSHREYRDDRLAVAATRLWPTEKNVIQYVLRCERPGDFHVMPTRAIDMYSPDVGGTGDEHRVSIREKN